MKHMKKILSIVLTVVFVIGILPMAQIAELDFSGVGDWFVNAFAAETVKSGTCGNNLTWELDDEGTLTISGTGDMRYYSSSYSVPWRSDITSIKTIILGAKVTSISNFAFSGCTGLTTIAIPESVKSIGDRAFYGCTNLMTIEIPDSVTSIGELVFHNTGLYNNHPDGLVYVGKCAYSYKGSMPSNTEIVLRDDTTVICKAAFSDYTGLISVIIPDSVTSIGEGAFRGCTGLTEITIPASVTSSGSSVFSGCSNLSTVNFSEGMLSIPANILKGATAVTTVNIPNGVTSIGNNAFQGCISLTAIHIPDSVTSIGNYTFQDCAGLTAIDIPNGLTSIGSYTFSGCSGLTVITIPDSVTNIESDAFGSCTGLTSIIIPANVTKIGYYGLFRGCTNLTTVTFANGMTEIPGKVLYGATSVNTVVIPDSVTSILSEAFSGCTGLTALSVPVNVTNISYRAFYGCTGLGSISINNPACMIQDSADTIPVETTIYGYNNSSAEEYADKYSRTFETLGDSPLFVVDSGSCGENLTWEYDSRRILTISGTGDMVNYSTTSAPWNAYRSSIKQIVISGASSIGTYAFYNCDNTSSVTIADSATNIGNYAFSGCAELNEIIIPDGVDTIGQSAFAGCSNLTEITLPASITKMGNGSSSTYSTVFYRCTNLKSVVFAEGTTAIPSYALNGCSSITTVVIPESVTSIGWSAFSGCSSLTDVNIPNSVTTISAYAFKDCTGLTSIVIPASVTTMGSSSSPSSYTVFPGCINIKTVVFAEGTTSVPSYALKDLSGVESITLPDTLTGIGDYAFSGCGALESICLPDSITSLGSNIFSGCENLSAINIPKNITTCNATSISSNSGYWNAVYHFYGPFANSGITSFEIPEDMSLIPANLFAGCSTVTSITIPDSITQIGARAFSDCSGLSNFRIPENVTDIGGNAFANCTGLTEITISPNVQTMGGGSYSTTCFSECSNLNKVTFADGMTQIPNYALYNLTSVTSIELPETLESFGYYSLYNCTGLTTVTIPKNVTSIGDTFKTCTNISTVVFENGMETIPASAFSGCALLTDVTIPNSVTKIGDSAFSGCTGMTEITFPENLKEIGDSAFDGCTGLTELNLPESIETIDRYAFRNCAGLSEMSLPNSLKTIGYEAFAGCSAISGSINIPAHLEILRGHAFSGCVGLSGDIYIPDTITDFGDYIFQGCSDITTLSVPVDLTYYGSKISGRPTNFGLTGLTEIEIRSGTGIMPDFVTYAYSSWNNQAAMYYKSTPWYESRESLTKITLDEGIQNIGTYAFYECDFAELTLPETLTTISDYAFAENASLKNVVIPSAVDSIGAAAFKNCESIDTIVIPSDVSEIKDHTFNGCTGLTTITIPADVTSVGDYAFDVCSSLTDVYYLASEEEWNHVTVGSNNDPLLNATFHYVHAHTFGDWVVTKEATCTTDGSHYKTCSDCGYVETEVIPALGHDFSAEWTIDTAMTCTVDEVKSHHCSRCEEKADVTVTKAPGHDYGDWTITREPSCTVPGSKYRTCSVCSNKETQSIPAPGHTYGDWTVTKEATVLEKGSKQRTCSVCGNVDKAAIDRITIDINENTNYGLANFTVVNAQTLAPIAGATLTISTDTDGTGTFTTDADGKVSAILPVGKQTVTANAANCLTRNLKVTIESGENNIPQIGMSSQSTYDAIIRSHEMTYDEIVAAGIDVDAADNNNIVDWELTLYFKPYGSFTSTPVELEYYRDENTGDTYGPSGVVTSGGYSWYWNGGAGAGAGVTGTGHFVVTEIETNEVINVYPVSEYYYLLIRGEVHWLKEMFDVEMLIINNSATDTLENLTATLELPDGLSLATMVDEQQTLSQSVERINSNSTETVRWYVRGDKAGDYSVTANLTGMVMPFEEEINDTFVADNSINVWGEGAFRLDFDCPNDAYEGEDFPITITLTNVSDKSLYNVEMIVKYIEQGRVTHYSDDTVVKEILMTEDTYITSGMVGEFKPGDQLVIEMSVVTLFSGRLYDWVLTGFAGEVHGWDKIRDLRDELYYGYDRFTYGEDFEIELDKTEESVIKYISEYHDISDLVVTSSDPTIVSVVGIIPGVGSKTEIDLDENMHVATVKLKGVSEGTATITVTAPNGLERFIDVKVFKREKQIVTFTTEKSMIIPTGSDMWLGFGLSDVETGEIEENWKRMAITVSNPNIVSLSDYKLTEYGYSLDLKGLRAGQTNLVITDTDSGANTIITVTVRDGYKETYLYSVDNIAARPMGNRWEQEFNTNIYDLNGIYVCNYASVKTSTGYDVTFDAYNSRYCYGAVDIYDANGIFMDYKSISPYSDISSLYDTGEQLYYLVTDPFNGKMLTYKQGSFSKHSSISFSVPDGGYFTISNNVTESKGAFFANAFELLYEAVSNIAEFVGEGTKPGDMQKFVDSFSNSFAQNIIDARNETLKGTVKKVVTEEYWKTVSKNIEKFTKKLVKANAFDVVSTQSFVSDYSEILEEVLEAYKFDWKAALKSVVGGGERIFEKLSGPAGLALKACFSITKLTNFSLMAIQMAKSTNAQYVTAYAGGNKDINPYGVIVDRQGNMDAEAVLQVFRVSNSDAVEVVLDSDNPLQKHEVYNICFVKNDTTVQPSGKVKVYIPIPLGLKKETCIVYRQENDGNWAILEARVEGNYLVFETNHFSLYAVIGDAYELVVQSLPNKTVYNSNETLNTEGLVVSMGNTTLEGGYVITPRVVHGEGIQHITVSYGDLTTTFDVEIQESTDPNETDPNACKWCGEVHTGFWGKFVGFFHKIAYFFAHLFGKR